MPTATKAAVVLNSFLGGDSIIPEVDSEKVDSESPSGTGGAGLKPSPVERCILPSKTASHSRSVTADNL